MDKKILLTIGMILLIPTIVLAECDIWDIGCWFGTPAMVIQQQKVTCSEYQGDSFMCIAPSDPLDFDVEPTEPICWWESPHIPSQYSQTGTFHYGNNDWEAYVKITNANNPSSGAQHCAISEIFIGRGTAVYGQFIYGSAEIPHECSVASDCEGKDHTPCGDDEEWKWICGYGYGTNIMKCGGSCNPTGNGNGNGGNGGGGGGAVCDLINPLTWLNCIINFFTGIGDFFTNLFT